MPTLRRTGCRCTCWDHRAWRREWESFRDEETFAHALRRRTTPGGYGSRHARSTGRRPTNKDVFYDALIMARGLTAIYRLPTPPTVSTSVPPSRSSSRSSGESQRVRLCDRRYSGGFSFGRPTSVPWPTASSWSQRLISRRSTSLETWCRRSVPRPRRCTVSHGCVRYS